MNKIIAERKDKILIVFSVLLGILYFVNVFFYGHGIGTVVFFLCYYGVIFYAGKGKDNFSVKKGKIYFIPVIILLICFLIYDNYILNFFNVLLIMVLVTLHTASMFSQNDTENPVVLFLKGFFQRPLENCDKIFKVSAEKTEDKKSGNIRGIIIGVLIGLPILIFVTVLLCSADQKFENLIENMFSTIDINVFRIFMDIFFGLCLSIFIYGALYYNRHNSEISEKKNRKPFIINSAVGTTVLFMISISYIIYLALQFEYLFSALAGKLPENFIYSQYARNGFFELFVIAVLNFALAAFFISTAKGKILKISVFLISAITLLLIVSSISKMFLYISRYDLTRLRVYTSWFMAALFIIFVVIIVKLFNEKIKLINISFIVFVSMYLILNIVNTDSIIGKYNTNNYINGNRKNIDIENIASLSDNGIYHLIKIARGNYPESEQAKKELSKRKFYINNKKEWQSFNVSTLILKEKIKDFEEYDYTKEEEMEETTSEKVFHIGITNDSESEFIEIDTEFYIGDKVMGSFGVNNADGSYITSGERMIFDFTSDELYNSSDLSEFSARFYVILSDGTKLLCNPEIKINSEYGKIYEYSIIGNEREGFELLYKEGGLNL